MLNYELSINEATSSHDSTATTEYLEAYADYTLKVRAVNARNAVGHWETLTLKTITTGEFTHL